MRDCRSTGRGKRPSTVCLALLMSLALATPPWVSAGQWYCPPGTLDEFLCPSGARRRFSSYGISMDCNDAQYQGYFPGPSTSGLHRDAGCTYTGDSGISRASESSSDIQLTAEEQLQVLAAAAVVVVGVHLIKGVGNMVKGWSESRKERAEAKREAREAEASRRRALDAAQAEAEARERARREQEERSAAQERAAAQRRAVFEGMLSRLPRAGDMPRMRELECASQWSQAAAGAGDETAYRWSHLSGKERWTGNGACVLGDGWVPPEPKWGPSPEEATRRLIRIQPVLARLTELERKETDAIVRETRARARQEKARREIEEAKSQLEKAPPGKKPERSRLLELAIAEEAEAGRQADRAREIQEETGKERDTASATLQKELRGAGPASTAPGRSGP